MAYSRIVKRGLAAIAVAVGATALAGFVLQRKAVFPIGMTRGHVGGDVHPGTEVLWTEIDDGRVEAWLLLGEGVDAAHPGSLVFFAHGNAELIDRWPQRLRHYHQRGISVLLVEYRGYGRSGGSPSEQGIVADYVAFYDRIVQRPEVDANRIILHGRSLGGGVVCGLAKQRPAAALILQSTFTSISDFARERWFVPSFLIRDPFDNLAAVSSFSGPVLVAHGRGDTLIPVSHGYALHEAAEDGTLVLMDGGHNDVPPSWPDFWRDVDAFLARAELLPTGVVDLGI